MRHGMRYALRPIAGSSTIVAAIWVGLLAVASSTASAQSAKLTRKQVEADAKTQFSLWLEKTFTKCGSSYFAKSHYYTYVYEFEGPTLVVGPADRTFDKLNNVTTVTVPLRFSAQKSRVSARPDTLLWSPGLRGLMSGGSQNAELTATRVNDQWTVEPGSWYYDQRMGPIACDDIPDSMAPPHPEGAPASAGTSAEGAAKQNIGVTTAETTKPSEPSRVDPTQPANPTPTSDNDWFLLTALECEPKNPRDLLALGKGLGQSMSARDVKEGGRIVSTTITAADGSSVQFYRGKARCEAALQREAKDLDRYK